MSDEIDKGGPAFPIETTATPYAPGMTMRDWFAGQAPVTILDAAHACGFTDLEEAMRTDAQRVTVFAVMAMMRWEYADAMIAARKGGAA